MDKWEAEMQKRKTEHNELIDELKAQLENVNRENDSNAFEVRRIAEMLIENAISQNNMYR